MKKITVKTMLSQKHSFNLYKGCIHGSIYCNSNDDINDFEDVVVKDNYIEILEKELSKKKTRFMIHNDSIIDSYLPIESEIEYTKKTLEVVYKYAYGVSLLTKSNLILRDIDLIDNINKQKRAVIMTTLSTFDDEISKLIEPNISTTKERFEMLCEFNKRNIDTVVCITPLLPFINDSVENIKGILDYCKKSGVKAIITFGLGLDLRDCDKEFFYDHLECAFPKMKDKYLKYYDDSTSLVTSKKTMLENIVFKFCLDNNIIYGNEKVFEFLNHFPERETLFDFETEKM